MIDATLLEVVRPFDVDAEEVSIDSDGLETTSPSPHYKARTVRTKKTYVKLSVCVMGCSLLPLRLVVAGGRTTTRRTLRNS